MKSLDELICYLAMLASRLEPYFPFARTEPARHPYLEQMQAWHEHLLRQEPGSVQGH